MDDTLAIALDFGGTKVESALVDASGAVVDGSRHRRPTGRVATEHGLELAVREVLAPLLAQPSGSRIRGIGIGTAGPIDRTRGRVSPLNLPAWRDYPLRDFVDSIAHEAGHSYPVFMESDGVAITVAEKWVGAAHGENNIMGMVISTGIGGGLILAGRVIPGGTGNAGHIGHVAVAGIEGRATFGAPSALEAVASGPHTSTWARDGGLPTDDGESLATHYGLGQPVAVEAVSRSAAAVAQAIMSATALLDLDVVAIGGGFSRVTPDFVPLIRRQVANHYFEFVRKVRVVPTALSDAGPLIGAAALVYCRELFN